MGKKVGLKDNNVDKKNLKIEIVKYLKRYSLREVVNLISEKNKLPNKEIYDLCLKIKKYFFKINLICFYKFLCRASSVGVFGSGVSIAFDPRSVGMQIDDSIMQKNLMGRLALNEKNILFL